MGRSKWLHYHKRGPTEISKCDFANPGRPLNPYTKFQCHWSKRNPDEENSLEGENGWNLCSICRNLRSIPSSWVQRCSSRKNFKCYTLQIVPRKRTIATIHETTWQRCVAQAKVENLKVVEPIGDLGCWEIPAFKLGHFNHTAFHFYQMAKCHGDDHRYL